MGVKGGDHKMFPLPSGVAATYAKMAVEGKAHRVLENKGDEKPGEKGKPKEHNNLFIFEKMGGMREIGITSLDPPKGWMIK